MLDCFQSQKEPMLIPFLMAGDPTLDATERFADRLIREGARALEIGVPFSDAMADGPVIQRAAERALRSETTLDRVLGLIQRIHQRHPQIPLIVFSYLNPLLKMGLETYTQKAKAAGAAATLVVDLPPEEAEEHRRVHAEQGLGTVFLCSPTTQPERMSRIAEASTAFVYYVSRTGVTGVQSTLSSTLAAELDVVKSRISRPLAVGFGIATGEQAQAVGALADAVVVGSAFVKLVEESPSLSVTEERIGMLAREFVQALARVRRNQAE